MEKVDILCLAFVIFIIINSIYIVYLKCGIKFILDKLAEHHHVIEVFLDVQDKINNSQNEFNTAVRELAEKLCNENSSTGGKKQSN